MKCSKAESFNKEASDPKNNPGFIVENLSLSKGQKIADIGSGGGYFAMRFAEIVDSKGLVYAVDVDPAFLAFIGDCAKEKGVTNIKTLEVNGKDGSSTLPIPEKSIDLVFMRNVYHHMKGRIDYMKGLAPYLKPNGRIAIVDYCRRRSSIVSLLGHYTSPEAMRNEMEAAGYSMEKCFDVLRPKSSFAIFSRKE
jgi:ubiquinone/menaquinone biosynthesis C-methylase UbiE